jgi:hypothetical protein
MTPAILTGCCVLVDHVLTSAITVIVMDSNSWPVDGDLLKVGSSMAVELSIEVREDTSLK